MSAYRHGSWFYISWHFRQSRHASYFTHKSKTEVEATIPVYLQREEILLRVASTAYVV